MSFIPFSISLLPKIEFGSGVLHKVPALAASCGKRVLLVTGGQSLRASRHWEILLAGLRRQGLSWESMQVTGEPSPQLVDDAVQQFKNAKIEVVVGIGGGSVLDAAKAVAGLLKPGNSVMDYLEGVGPELPYVGPATPFIAVPTTAGTGSEATKNAVLSVQGKHGFKKSFRDEQLVARHAVVDPDLLDTCPPELIAANGMDALTQLLESYVSTRANPFTDALAISGLSAVRDSLLPWFEGQGDQTEARARMAYASLLSGITLAQAGLGSVHGLASPLGAFYPIPHGVVCGTLVSEATRMNIDAMEAREPANPALKKYAQAGRLFRGRTHLDDIGARVFLVHTLSQWSGQLKLPRLSQYGVTEAELDHVVAHCRGSSMQTNPVVLTDAEVKALLLKRI
ncbi:MAG: iron-containing alcohol dehydrogenase [Hydrogenophilales bacterium]|nr:iron-containing alcohol dehydrogenase [Hydrogenophilales bacterium]